MRALMYDHFGDESVLALREIAEPRPAPNEVQVRVHLASLNPVDFKLRAGLYRLIGRPKRPAITGKDFAGHISALGAEARGFSVGQRVFGSVNPMLGAGSCAQTLVVGTDLIAPTPDAVSDETAACLPVASGTALQALEAIARLRRGQSLLVTGASGGVGSSAVQIARAIGARITGVCGSASIEYVRSLGADVVVDYATTDWRQLGATYDVIFDAAGASTFGAARRHLSPTGYYVNTFPRPSMFVTCRFVGLVSKQHSVPFMLSTDARQLRELAKLAQDGVLRPRVAKTVGLQEVASAQREMQQGRIHGKICVSIGA